MATNLAVLGQHGIQHKGRWQSLLNTVSDTLEAGKLNTISKTATIFKSFLSYLHFKHLYHNKSLKYKVNGTWYLLKQIPPG